MANLHFMEDMIRARLNEFHDEADAHRLVKIARAEQASRAKKLLNSVVSFAKRLSTHSSKAVETSEVPQIKLRNEQVS